jgi:hypothetical protein
VKISSIFVAFLENMKYISAITEGPRLTRILGLGKNRVT